MEGFRKMTLTKKQNKEIEDEVDHQKGMFLDSIFVLVDNMHFKADFGKQEITKILIRDLKEAINVSFEDYVEMTKPELHTFRNRNYNKHMKKDFEK